MPTPTVDTASLSFRLRVLDAVAMSQHGDAVMDQFAAFILAYDPGLTKGPLWLDVPFKPQHDWAVQQAYQSGQYDPGAFWAAYAKVTSEVFFLQNATPPSGLAHPTPGAWGPTSLLALPENSDGAIYVWEYDNSTAQWVRVCYGNFGLVDPSGAGPVSPTVTIGGVAIATVGVSLAYGDAGGLA